MNIKKVEKSIKKINQLLENIKEENAVSSIERDLLLSYIRDLYEKVLNADGSNPKPAAVKKPTKFYQENIEISTPVSRPPVEIADVVRQEIIETAQPTRTVQDQPTPVVENKVQVETLPPVVEEAPQTPEAPQELLDLFASESGNEISDKLGRSPIADLTKSMGINERIFTVNELFGGDTSLFNTTMSAIDKLTSLEQARDYLVTNVAIDQNWASEGKIKKVANFVKLISRRY